MLQFGIWEFDEKKGLTGRPVNFPAVHLQLDNIWDLSLAGNAKVWKWPLQYARNPWCTPRIANDFNKAFFYAQKKLRKLQPNFSEDFQIKARTIQSQTELLNDYFCTLDGETIWITSKDRITKPYR